MARPDPLATYNAKRDFKRTKEPRGDRSDSSDGHLFIVQKHDATRLHWDFRLEMDGVLKSWAVTRGPSPDPDDKRLAVRTEDHPLSYAGFEGTIPKSEYGGGTVMLWDVGTWEPVGGKDPTKTIEDGHVHVMLHGQRMQGEWLLVRMKPRPGEKRENWLLRKVADAHAGASGDLVDTALTSIESGRSMAAIAKGDDPVWHSDIAKAKADKSAANAPGKTPPKVPIARRPSAAARKPPGFLPLQLATLSDTVPGGSGWIHEVKFDGYRILLSCAKGAAKAYTRSGLDWSDRFAPIVAAAIDLAPQGALIDGEVVALDEDGRPSFSALQAAFEDGGPFHYFAFDLLEEGGEDLRDLGQVERKARLSALLDGAGPPIHYTEHVEKGGEALFDRLCRDGYEGIVSKAANAPYRGRRTRHWLKVKCTRRQEFVILGYAESNKAGRDLRSLLVGVQEDGGLRYAGKVGTGFDAATREMILARLKQLARKTAPADVPKVAARGAQWVTPKLVAEVAFAEFTADKVLRHASFLGLREDKSAKDVILETATPATPGPQKNAKPFGVTISHPDRIVFPDSGTTKGDLASYYAAIAEPMLRWLADRPVSLVRCPQGRGKHCFFQKHDSGSFGGKVSTVAIREKNGGEEEYLVVDSGAAILTCVQMGTIEFHGWGAPASNVEHPDRMVFDLDPDEGLDFAAVRDAAVLLRDQLSELGLQSYPMASGGKGIHVIVPLDGTRDWPEVKDFAGRFSRALAQALPKIFTANMRKADRKGRIFLDWLRNERGATAVLPYSVRAREHPSVATPITWDELATLQSARPYTIDDVAELLARGRSAKLQKWCSRPQPLPDF